MDGKEPLIFSNLYEFFIRGCIKTKSKDDQIVFGQHTDDCIMKFYLC